MRKGEKEVSKMMSANNRDTFLITLGGSLTGLGGILAGSDLLKTCVLASAGTVSSFIVTMGLKWLVRKGSRKG